MKYIPSASATLCYSFMVTNGTFLKSSLLIKKVTHLFRKKTFISYIQPKYNTRFSLCCYFIIFLKIKNIFLDIYIEVIEVI